MLTELHIENFAIIDRLDLQFSPGLITFTGETGAGKSIIIDAVETILGGRSDATLVRSGAQRATVEGAFRIPQASALEIRQILEREELTHIKAQAAGADNKIGSRMKIDLDVNLRTQDDKTILGFVAGVDILGKLAALGHGIIKRKADQVLDEFAQAVKKKLEGEA